MTRRSPDCRRRPRSLPNRLLVLLQRGGIRPGMRVLDLGTGPGDVAFQVAEMVGPGGYVVGVEQDPAQLTVAEQRREQMGVGNVAFRQGDARTFLDEEPFDAVVCRLLLMHLPDAVDVLRHHVRNLRPGGVFVAVDYDMGGARALPEVELYSRIRDWLKAGFEYAHANPSVGMRFPVIFEQAGLREVGTLGLQVYWPPAKPACRYVRGRRGAGSQRRHRGLWCGDRGRNGPRHARGPAERRDCRCRRGVDDADGGRRVGSAGLSALRMRFRSRTCCNVGWDRSAPVGARTTGAVFAVPRAPSPRVISEPA